MPVVGSTKHSSKMAIEFRFKSINKINTAFTDFSFLTVPYYRDQKDIVVIWC